MEATEEEGWSLLKAAPHCFKIACLLPRRSEAGGRHGCCQGLLAERTADMFVTLSSAAIDVSKLAVDLFVALVVCYRAFGAIC